MCNYLPFLIIPVLGIITVQDFKTRQISILWMGVLFIMVVVYALDTIPVKELFQRIIGNSLLSFFILLSGTLLVKLKNTGCHPRKSMIGAGDFLFLLSLSPLLSFSVFLVFLNFSFLLILCSTLLYKVISKKHPDTIPLAGGMSAITGIILLLEVSIKTNILAGLQKLLMSSLW